jgi:peptide/nickel transport system permease protein
MSATIRRRRQALSAGQREFLRVLPFVAILLLLVGAAVLAPWLSPYSPTTQDLLGRLKPPGFTARRMHFLLGSDDVGRDLLSRLIWGARVSLFVAFASVTLSGIVGTTLGMLAGYLRGPVEIVLMRLVDIFLSIPAILLAIIAVAILGPGLGNIVIILTLTRWPRYARMAYSQTFGVAGMPYVRMSRFFGAGTIRVLVRHILPNILGALIVVATLEFGQMVLFEAGLSFLGLGTQPPTPSWGAMLSVGKDYVASAWWIATFPGVCLFLLVLSSNQIGEAIGNRLDPKRRRG